MCEYLIQPLNIVAGALVALFAPLVTRWLSRPRLKLQFVDGDQCFRLPTQEVDLNTGEEHAALYVRLKVTQGKGRTAKNCRAFITDLRKRDCNGRWAPTAPRYCDWIPLRWSYRGDDDGTRGVSLLRKTSAFVDVLSVRECSHDLKFESVDPWPLRYKPLLAQKGSLLVTVQAFAEEGNTECIHLVVEWDGVCQHVSAREQLSIPGNAPVT
jgi:hypothetical protein